MHPANQPPARNPSLPVPNGEGTSPDNTNTPLTGAKAGTTMSQNVQAPPPAKKPAKGEQASTVSMVTPALAH